MFRVFSGSHRHVLGRTNFRPLCFSWFSTKVEDNVADTSITTFTTRKSSSRDLNIRWWHQYANLKQAYPEHILLFQMGDFYEIFGKDAEKASSLLDIVLTQKRAGGYGGSIAMAGIPVHAAEGYIARLVKQNCLVAVCEQTTTKSSEASMIRGGGGGLLERRVTRLLSPGTITDESLLEPRSHQYLAAVLLSPDGTGGAIAWVDVSTGMFHVSTTTLNDLRSDLARIMPKEVLMETWLADREDLRDIRERYFVRRRSMADSIPCRDRAETLRTGDAKQSDMSPMEWMACGAVMDYCSDAQPGRIPWFERPIQFHRHSMMKMDEVTRRSLEIVESATRHELRGSLLHAMDQTVTGAGARLLANRLRE
jgi:DNA mismatch repair protein MutS